MKITRFRVKKVFGVLDVSLRVDGPCLILVGPNGIGKSTVVGIFFAFITKQYKRILEYDFSEIEAFSGATSIKITREDVLELVENPILELPASSRLSQWVRRLAESGEVENYTSIEHFNPVQTAHFAQVTGMPREEVRPFQQYFKKRYYNVSSRLSGIQKKISEFIDLSVDEFVLYLPTYRRIERDIEEIFPEVKDQLRRILTPEMKRQAGKRGKNFEELVYFGMEDVKMRLDERMEKLRGFSLDKYNSLSGVYLKDVINNRAQIYNDEDIVDEKISDALERVSEAALSAPDKDLLRERLKSMLDTPKNKVSIHDKYLAHYFSRLLSVFGEIKKKEGDILRFVNTCNHYLGPNKNMVYDEIKSRIFIQDRWEKPIELAALSSGEKQIVSIFTHLYFIHEGKAMLIIDEPELSLSVPWQERLLEDVLDTGRCSFVMAVTHSPFIYDNDLIRYSVDMRKFSKRG